jgi:hypothetical protein
MKIFPGRALPRMLSADILNNMFGDRKIRPCGHAARQRQGDMQVL